MANYYWRTAFLHQDHPRSIHFDSLFFSVILRSYFCNGFLLSFKNLNSFVSFRLYSSLLLFISLRSVLVVLCNVIRIFYLLVHPIRIHAASSHFSSREDVFLRLFRIWFSSFSGSLVFWCSPGLLPSFQGFGMILSIDLSRSWSHTSPYLASPLFSFGCLLRSIFPSELLLVLAAFCSCSCFLDGLAPSSFSWPPYSHIHFRLLSSLTSSPAFLFILLPRLLFFSSLLKTRLN